MVVLTMGLLGALEWALHPSQPHFTPAPLSPISNECPRLQREFVPSNITEFPDPPLNDLSPEQKTRTLYRLNMEPCTCGCGLSVAACRLDNTHCEISKNLAQKIVAEVQAETRSPK